MKRSKTLMILFFFTLALAQSASAEFYTRAPDVLPGTIPEMYKAEYWIAKMKEPDTVILTPAAIQKMNESYQQRMKAADPFQGAEKDRLPNQDDLNRWPGRYISLPDLASMTPSRVAAVTREEVSKDIAFMRGKYSRSMLGLKIEFREFGNMLGIKYTDWELDRFEQEMSLDRIGNEITPLDAVTVCDARLRIVPSFTPEQIGLMENGKTRWDVWNVNVVRIGSPVQVLHSTRSGAYVFALSPEGYGWIRSEDVAFATKAEIRKLTNPADFVVCTGDWISVYSDEKCRFASCRLRLGDRLPLVSKSNPRMVNIPLRRANGKLALEQAWLAKDADVSVGWKPYTRRNVAAIAFKMLGNPYDWSMGWYGRNHETTIRDIFACFGFDLPFNAELFTFYSDNNKRVVRPAEGKAVQHRAMLETEPFITIMTMGGGHSSLFIGEHNNEPIILDTNGYGYDQDGVRHEIRRWTVTTTSQPDYFLKTNFTFCTLK